VNAIDAEKIEAKQDPSKRAHMLAEEFDWDVYEAKKIWAFGPDNTGPNLLVD